MKVSDEKLSAFYNDVVFPLSIEHRTSLKTLCQEKRDEFSANLLTDFAQLMEKAVYMQQQNTKGKAAYIVLSFLRCNIYAQLVPDICRFDMYDESDYEDEHECCVYMSVPWINESILAFDKSIRVEIRKSSIKLPDYRIEAVVLSEIAKFAEVLSYLLRYSIPEIEKLESWHELSILDYVDIRFGEFREDTISIYKYDTKAADESVIKHRLQEKNSMHYYSVKNSNLSHGNYDGIDLRFTDFSGSNFEGSSFVNSYLTGTSWRNCNLKNVNFTGSNLIGADFRGAIKDTAIFDNTTALDAFW